jgi:hypothetical protein
MPEDRPEEWTAVGIDVAEERKGLDLVALDGRRRLQASFGRLTISDVADIVLRDLRPAIVCIDSPSGWSTSGKSRMAERELRKLGITAFSTGEDPGDHPFYRWMRVGFALYEALSPPYELLRGGPRWAWRSRSFLRHRRYCWPADTAGRSRNSPFAVTCSDLTASTIRLCRT